MENPINVLIADDDNIARRELVRRLRFRDVLTKDFPTAEGLLSYLQSLDREDWPTAILMDYVLEDMPGDKLVTTLLEKYPQLPIIVISGLDVQGSIRAYGMGAYAIMQKPIDHNELQITLQELANRNDLAMRIARNMKEITEFDCCMVWQLDRHHYPNYRITGADGKGADKDFSRNTIMKKVDYPRLNLLTKGEPIHYQNIQRVKIYKNKEEAAKRGWVSLLSLPIIRHKRLVGWIDCYKGQPFKFKTARHKIHQLGYLKHYAILAGDALYAQEVIQHSRVIHETNQSLAGTLQEELIYQTILEKAIATTGADCGWIYRYLPKDRKIELAATAGPGSDEADISRHLKAGGVTGIVAKNGQSIYVKDVEKKERGYNPRLHIPTPGLEEKSILAVPLRRGERTLGVLTIKSGHRNFFTPDDMQFLTGLAAISAVGMERNKLSNHLQGISRKAQEATRFEPLADYVVQAVHDLTNAVVNLWMISKLENEGDNYLRLVRSSQPSLLRDYEIIPTALNSSISAKALHEKKHQFIADLQNYCGDPPFINLRALQKHGWRSLLAVPLIGKNDEHLGVVSLLSKDVNKFANDDGMLVQHFANQAALALQEQRHITILQELAKIGQELTTALTDTKTYLQKVVNLSQKITGATSTVLYPYDAMRHHFYDNEYNVYAGDLRFPKKKFSEKPRVKGLAALIRKYGVLIVEHINQEGELKMYTGLHQQQLCVPDSEAYKQALLFIKESQFIRRENIQAFIGVSLRAKEQPEKGKIGQLQEVAVLYFNFRSPRHFSEEELQVIDIFCHQVANVIHRNRLFYSLKKERELIEGVHQSALHILSERKQRRRLEKIVAEAVRLLHAKGGKVYLINASKQELKLVAKKNLPNKLIRVGACITRERGIGMAWEVVESKEYKVVNDYAKYKKHIPELANFFSAVVEVPLLFNEEVIGVLGVFDNKETRTFSDEDVRILERLAAQAALAIYNIRLYDELDALNQTGLQIAQQAGLHEIAKRILRELKRVIDYDKATIQLIKGEYQIRESIAHAGYKDSGNAKEFTQPIKNDKLILDIYESKRTKILGDTHLCSLWNRSLEATRNVRSWACLPLVYGKKVLGLLMLDHHTQNYYTDKDKPKLERFALQAAIGINNALVEREHLKKLSNFAKVIQNSQDGKMAIFNTLLYTLTTILDPNKLRFTYYYKDDKYIIPLITKVNNLKWRPLTYRNTIPSWVAQEKEVKLLPDDNKSLLKSKGQKLLGPIWKEGEVAGILEISTLTNLAYRDIENVFSALLALASNAILREHLRERKVEAFERRFNPYIVGLPIKSPQQFFGRESIIQQIIDGIYQNNYLIEDERRIGKTSVLYQIKHHLEQKTDSNYTFYPVFVDLEATEEADFWRHLCYILYGILGKARPKAPKRYDFHDFRNDLDSVLELLKKENPNQEVQIILLMDEVDQFKIYSNQLLPKLRKLFQEEEHLKVVMAGVKVKRRLNDITSPWHNQLITLNLKEMTETQARALIMKPVTGIYTFEPKAIDLILAKSDRKPSLLQALCYHAVNAMLNRFKSSKNAPLDVIVIIQDDVQSAIKIVKENTPKQ